MSRKLPTMTIRIMLLAGFLVAWVATSVQAETEPTAVSKHVDALLVQEQFGGDEQSKPAVAAKEEVLLRRLSLDLLGVQPTPEEITAYALDPSADKAQQAARRMLADPRYGENWARYWHDVVMFRRSEDRGLIASAAMVNFLTASFNDNKPWDEIAQAFITATGDVREVGGAALIMAQMGNSEDFTAEVSRIFMGIQIQCAQCHDHPTDRWKREQFHQLAAFFPRIAVRPVRVDGKQRTFEVVSVDRGPKNKKANAARRGNLEHHMPDLQQPEAQGKLMQPVFFLSGQQLEPGLKDAERRSTISAWLTNESNPWFAKAFVNRIWSEMVGRGFYEPVDDIGPDRQCSAPQTLDYLAAEFAANKYDVKWLFETIASTDAYARRSVSRTGDDAAPFVAACPQRLRGDQLYNALVDALGIQERPNPRKDQNYRTPQSSTRGQINQAFGYDPSVRRDEIAGTIPQALFLMNSPLLARAINGKQANTELGQLLESTPDNQAVVIELYLRCLAREPKQTEIKSCLEYVASSDDRAAAFEDVLWALVNSTEFLNRK